MSESQRVPFSEIIEGLMSNSCPHCREGRVFVGVFKYNKTCTHCGYAIEREPGYFLAANMISYSAGFIVILPTLLLLLFSFDVSGTWLEIIPSIELLIILPFMFRFSRLFWLYFDYKIDSSKTTNQD